jgi:GTPase SAR1 family protein
VPPGGSGTADPMTWTVLTLCDEAAGVLIPAARSELDALRSALTEPLRIAVVGRVSTGKSTLVNALIGRRVAPTAAGECTQVVTWYRFGGPDRAQLVLRDGSVRPLPFHGSLPENLGVDPASVERIEVTLQSGPLRQLTLIDTPGLGSLDRPDQDTGEVSVRAAGQATALLFLFRDVEKQDDIEFIRAYQAATRGTGTGSAGVIGVLSHADVFGAGPWSPRDPLLDARELAARIRRDHPNLLLGVTPVAALLAAAARTGQVTESGARTLAALRPVETARLQMLPRFGVPDGVDPAAAGRLLAELGPYAVNRGREVAPAGAASLQDWLLARSGIAEIEDLVARRFVRRCIPLTVERVLRGLRELARTRCSSEAAGAWLRDRIERAELAPHLHRIAELRARQAVAACRGPVAAEVGAQLELMIDNDEPWRQLGADRPLRPDELRAALNQRWDRAQTVITTARDPRIGDAARVLTRSYALASDQLAADRTIPRSREHPGSSAYRRG